MNVKQVLAILAGALAVISLFMGPGLVLLAVAVILLAVSTLV